MQSFTEFYNLLVMSRHYLAVEVCSMLQQQRECSAVSSVSCDHQRCVTWRRKAVDGLWPPSHLPPPFPLSSSYPYPSSCLSLVHPHPSPLTSSLTLVPPPFFLIHDLSSYMHILPSPLSLPCESTDSSSSFSSGKSISKIATPLTPSPCPHWHNTAW